MGRWTLFLGGLLVWAAHFFLIYGIGSIFLTSPIARLVVAAATALAAAANITLILEARRRLKREQDGLERWMAALSLPMAALSLVAVLWQGFPALLS